MSRAEAPCVKRRVVESADAVHFHVGTTRIRSRHAVHGSWTALAGPAPLRRRRRAEMLVGGHVRCVCERHGTLSENRSTTVAYGSTMSTTRMCVVPDANAIEAAAAALGHLQGRWGGHSPQGPTCTSFGRLDLSQTPASTDALFPTLHPEFTSWKCPCQCDRLHSPHMPQLSSAATMRDLVGL